MINQITIIAGALLAVVGLVGYVAPNLMGMHLSDEQYIVYLFTGGAALGVIVLAAGLSGRMAVRMPALIGTKKVVRIFQHPNHRCETPEGLIPVAKGETAVNKHPMH